MKINIERKRKWLDTIENDMRTACVCVEDVGNRDKWKFKTRVADP